MPDWSTIPPDDRPDAPGEQTVPVEARRDTLTSSGGTDFRHGRFEPGQRLGSRYRVVARLGEGGMGEVYRADDLELGQSVALKFLPERVAADESWLRRFRNEVRTARQIAHPNVCRIYDIGQADGHVFLSMEYVDGEDLSGVLRRLGRPSREKAVEIARQICLGLAAAHDAKVLHRDLKPANIMIDGRGRVRITDFGLAGFLEELEGAKARAGTPAYMAPEQLAEGQVSVRSDVYSLGLVLYELFTGKCVFDTNDVDALKRRHSSGSITPPSSISEEIDPTADRVIRWCLEHDPSDRPSSVFAVLAALPGGDALQAMLEAGETPSPELVAASGRSGVLTVRVASALAAIILVAFAVGIGLRSREPVHLLAGGMLPPEVLSYRAREIIEAMGYEEAPAQSARGFGLRGIESTQDSSLETVRAALRRELLGAHYFWYREHDRSLEPVGSTLPGSRLGEIITQTDPPMSEPGMIAVQLSAKGRLLRFERVTDEFPALGTDSGGASAPTVDWPHVLEVAALADLERTETTPKRAPRAAWDERRAWLAPAPDDPARTLRIEAAAFGGRVTSFSVHDADREAPRTVEARGDLGFMRGTILFGVLVGGVLAFRNLRLGRGDRRGAARLAVLFFCLTMLGWLASTSHSRDFAIEARLLISGLSYALTRTAFACMLYVALEPYIRRLLPLSLVSWSRLLAGRWRDPIVGRDVLVGLAVIAALFATATLVLAIADPRMLFYAAPLHEVGTVIGHMFRAPVVAVGTGLTIITAFVIVNWIFARPRWLAPVVFWILVGAGFFGAVIRPEADPVIATAIFGVVLTAFVFVVYRFGLLCLLLFMTINEVLQFLPITLDFSTWYVTPTVVMLLLVIAATAYGFVVSTAGQSWISHGPAERANA